MPCGLAGAVVPRGDEAVELAAQHAELLVGAHLRHRLHDAVSPAVGALLARPLALPRVQELAHLVGLEQAGDAEEVHLLLRARRAPRRSGRTARPRRGRGRTTRSSRAPPTTSPARSEAPSSALAWASRSSSAAKMSPSSVTRRPSTWSRCASMSEANSSRCGTDGRNTDAVSPRRPGAHEAADGLGEEQRRRGRGRPHADGQARHVDALGDHPHGHHPALVGVGEGRDLLRRALLVREHDGGRLPGDLLQQRGVGARGVLVAGDDQPAGVGDVAAYLREPPVGRLQHRRHPRPLRVERGTQRLGVHVLGERLAEPGDDLVAGAGAPLHLAGVGHEQHRPHDVVGQRVGVAVGEVGDRGGDAVVAGA